MLSNIIQYVTGLLGITGVTWGLLAFFAPGLLSAIAEYIKAMAPLFRGVLEGVVELFKIIYSGLKDIFDNFSTIVTVGIFVTIAYFHGLTSQPPKLIAKPVEVIRKIRNVKPKPPSNVNVKRLIPRKKDEDDDNWKSFLNK